MGIPQKTLSDHLAEMAGLLPGLEGAEDKRGQEEKLRAKSTNSKTICKHLAKMATLPK